MSIIHQATRFIQEWEQKCQESNFSLRFPVFAEFITYLEENSSAHMFDKIISDERLLKNIRSFFYAMLRAYIQDLCIQEDIWEEKLAIA